MSFHTLQTAKRRVKRANPMNILIVEDDLPLGSVLQQSLAHERHTTKLASDGESAVTILNSESFELIILDLSLPKLNGFEVLRHLRANNLDIRALVVSGSSRIEERVRSLDAGADDFLAKPFSLQELTARVRALGRRHRPTPRTTLTVADLVIDRLAGCVERAGRRIELTSREYSLLQLLAANHGQPVSRSRILKTVWGSDGENTSNIVDVYINYLRRKIDGGFTDKLVHTVRGVGYCLGAQEIRLSDREQQIPPYMIPQLHDAAPVGVQA